MIRLTCNNCKSALDIDEAFAGGVCRCMYCGTIQTVPSHLKSKASAAKVSTTKSVPKALYSRRPTAVMPASQLDELGDVVASSGLVGSGLRSATSAARRAQQPTAIRWWRQRPVVFSIVGGAVSAILLLLVVFTVAGPSAPATSTQAAAAPTARPAAWKGATFCGVALNETTIVYVLDCGSATADMFGHLKEAAFRSAQSLGSDRKFQIIFWNNGGGEFAFPRTNPTYATPSNIEAARRALEDVHAHGQSDAKLALTKAFGSSPDVIVLATGKAYELDDSFVQLVEQVRGQRKAKVHTFSLGPGETGAALKAIATKTGGEFRAVAHSSLREFAE